MQVFRIYRDVRFSKDKSPYKLNMGASINPGGKKSMIPGYYIHIEPGKSFLAGGSYQPMPEIHLINYIKHLHYRNTTNSTKLCMIPSGYQRYTGISVSIAPVSHMGIDWHRCCTSRFIIQYFTHVLQQRSFLCQTNYVF